MASREIRSAEVGLIEALRRGHPPARRWTRRLARATAISAAAGFGVWMASILLPHWLEFRESQSAGTFPAVPGNDSTPVVRRDATTSTLGTTASSSKDAQQIVLASTDVAEHPADSTAMLGTDPRNPQTYGVGSMLSNGAVISEIHDDRVVLVLNGRKTSLVKGAAVSAPATTIGGPRSVSRPLDRAPTGRDAFSEIMRSQLVFERERVAGLQIFAGSRPAALEKLGLKEGDIVRTVEGRPVEGAAALQRIDKAVSAGSSIVVGVERDGNLMSLLLDGARLSES